MNVSEKYLETLKLINDWVIVSEWATNVGENYPELLIKANDDADNQAIKTTGLNQLAARISSEITRGAYSGKIEIDNSERPRKVRYISDEERQEHDEQELEEDIAPIQRADIIQNSFQTMSNQEKYRISELETISKLLKSFFGLEFQVDHAQALLNKSEPGTHHPDNLQLLLKVHNGMKSNSNWKRFTLDEQIDYIDVALKMQDIVATRFGIEMEKDILGSLIDRLKKVY